MSSFFIWLKFQNFYNFRIRALVLMRIVAKKLYVPIQDSSKAADSGASSVISANIPCAVDPECSMWLILECRVQWTIQQSQSLNNLRIGRWRTGSVTLYSGIGTLRRFRRSWPAAGAFLSAFRRLSIVDIQSSPRRASGKIKVNACSLQ